MASQRYIPVAQRKQSELNAAIPQEWRLPSDFIPAGMLSIAKSVSDPKYERVSVMDVPRKCGLLTPQELEFTEKFNVRALVAEMTEGRAKAEDVVRAFCKVRFVPHGRILQSLTISSSAESSDCSTAHPLLDRATVRSRPAASP